MFWEIFRLNWSFINNRFDQLQYSNILLYQCILLGWVLWHINLCGIVKTKSFSYIYVLWTPTYGPAKAGRPARTYIQQLCEDTGCSPENLPEAMNDREKWRDRGRDIRAGGTTWWWWWYIFYGISTIEGYLIPNPVHTYIYILYMYDLLGGWLCFMAYQPLLDI